MRCPNCLHSGLTDSVRQCVLPSARLSVHLRFAFHVARARRAHKIVSIYTQWQKLHFVSPTQPGNQLRSPVSPHSETPLGHTPCNTLEVHFDMGLCVHFPHREGLVCRKTHLKLKKFTPNLKLTFGSFTCPSGSHTFRLIRQTQCVLDNSFLFWALLMNLLVCTLRFDRKARNLKCPPYTQSVERQRNPRSRVRIRSPPRRPANADSWQLQGQNIWNAINQCKLQATVSHCDNKIHRKSLTHTQTDKHTGRHNSSLTLLWHRTQMEKEMCRDRGIGIGIEIEKIMLMQ